MPIRTSVTVLCTKCRVEFFVQPHRFKSGRGKFCSKECRKDGIFTPEVRKKMSDARKGKPTGRTGDKCHFWRGGVTQKNKSDRMSLGCRLWRKEVYERDNYTCVFCGQKGGKLNADHIKSFAKFPALRFDINNGRTLCVECHRKTDTYGWRSLIK